MTDYHIGSLTRKSDSLVKRLALAWWCMVWLGALFAICVIWLAPELVIGGIE